MIKTDKKKTYYELTKLSLFFFSTVQLCRPTIFIRKMFIGGLNWETTDGKRSH
jgi:hypothetical protein